MILAEIPFQCPQCDRSYRMKVDLLKLTRLNRIAVCGRCKHQFDVSVHLGTVSDSDDELMPLSPIRLTPSHIPLIEPPTPVPEEDSLPPPVSGPFRAVETPPPFSRPKRRTSPASGWPQSDAESPSPGPKDAKWPSATTPRRGWSKRPDRGEQDTEPTIPRADRDTEPASMPAPFDFELDLPDARRVDKKDSLVRKKRKELVVEVGDRKGKNRRRNTYDPQKLVTEPHLRVPGANGDDDG